VKKNAFVPKVPITHVWNSSAVYCPKEDAPLLQLKEAKTTNSTLPYVAAILEFEPCHVEFHRSHAKLENATLTKNSTEYNETLDLNNANPLLENSSESHISNSSDSQSPLSNSYDSKPLLSNSSDSEALRANSSELDAALFTPRQPEEEAKSPSTAYKIIKVVAIAVVVVVGAGALVFVVENYGAEIAAAVGSAWQQIEVDLRT